MRRNELASAMLVCCLILVVAGGPAGAATDDQSTVNEGASTWAVTKALSSTHLLLLRARAAVNKRRAAKQLFREAIVQQRAARSVLSFGKPSVAMQLTLQARMLARKVLKANHVPLSYLEKKDTREEKNMAAHAPRHEGAVTTAEQEKVVPAASTCLKQDNVCDQEE